MFGAIAGMVFVLVYAMRPIEAMQQRGVEAFLSNFRSRAQPVLKEHPPRATDVRRRKKP
jgi:hypothetical protein